MTVTEPIRHGLAGTVASTGVKPDFPSYDDYLRADTGSVPEAMFEVGTRPPSSARISKDRFLSREYHEAEVQNLWKKVWQIACRENDIPAAGDFIEYSIADQSVVVVRQPDGGIRAFHNACLHRGSRLKDNNRRGNAGVITCPFHGWSWRNDGSVHNIPCQWDFEGLDPERYRLRPVRTDTWNGFVYVNFDPAAEPLADFIGPTLRRHFQRWPLGQRWKAVHLGKIVPCNWKVATKAFLEVYHFATTHPQIINYSGDINAKYDSFGRHARMMSPTAVSSPLIRDCLDEQEIADEMIGDMVADMFRDPNIEVAMPTVPPNGTARPVVAEWMRRNRKDTTGVDFSGSCDAEMLDVIQYYVFPNTMPWAGDAFPLMYRVRPHGNDPERALFEIMLLVKLPAGTPLPPDTPMRTVPEEQLFADCPELGGGGGIFDQDMEGLRRVQQGLHVDGLDALTLAGYQEQNIRGFLDDVDAYVRAARP
jgi:phenylpropionate dioxygenase-like ring-hydroxylating dioxygenase large terminal subunit